MFVFGEGLTQDDVNWRGHHHITALSIWTIICYIQLTLYLEYLANIVKVTDPFTATLYVFLFKFFSDHNPFYSLRIIKLSLEALTLNNGIILKGITHA